MIKKLCLFLILILLMEIPVLGATSLKVLEGKEIIWKGEVELSGDVLVPEGSKLTIMPGTRIYGVYEYNNNTFTPEEWKIIVKGELVAVGEAENSIVFDPIPYGLSAIRIPIDPEIKNITIAPKEIDTEEIRKEFAAFKTQYLVLWILLFGSIYYAIQAR